MTAYNVYIGCITQSGRYLGPTRVRDTVLRTLNAHQIDGATLRDATGVWHGNVEPTVIVTLSGVARDVLEAFARHIRDTLDQEAVGVQPTNPLEFI